MGDLALRPLMPEDADAVRALVLAGLAGTRYLTRALEQLDAALAFEDPEYLAVLAERGATLSGLALFGSVAGARECTRLHQLIGDADSLVALADAVVQVCEESGERLVACELPDDERFAAAHEALLASGFAAEGRIEDYVAEGVGLRFLAWRAGPITTAYGERLT